MSLTCLGVPRTEATPVSRWQAALLGVLAGKFPKSVCTSVNEVVCHGIPDSRPLQDGDIINIDVTVYLDVRQDLACPHLPSSCQVATCCLACIACVALIYLFHDPAAHIF